MDNAPIGPAVHHASLFAPARRAKRETVHGRLQISRKSESKHLVVADLLCYLPRVNSHNLGPAMRKILAVVVLICSFLPSEMSPPASAQIAGLTIGAAIQSLTDLVKELENGAQALIQQGNTALAQQQMLAAGIMQQLINQMSDTYKGRLDDTFQKIGITQGNVAGDVTNVLKNVGQIEHATAADAQNIVYQLQGGVNQIIKELPFVSREPVFYGMLVYDIYSQIPKKGFDLELLGLNLTDPTLNYKIPIVKVAGDVIPPSNISVQEDRVQVALTDSVKQKIGFKDDFCAPQSSFSVSMQAFYETSKNFVFIPIHSETSVTFTSFALKGPERFVANITTSGITSTRTPDTKTFSVKQQGQVTFGCEENNSGSISYKVPDGATVVNCTASWVDISNTKTQSASCAVGGTTVTASGTL
jgi:hypothetical protein